MDWLRGLLGKSVTDSVLGKLELRGDTWCGDIDWPDNNLEHLAGFFYHSRHKPDASLGERFQRLQQDYLKLKPSIQRELYRLWSEYEKRQGQRFPLASTDAALWPKLGMTGLNMDDSAQITLLYGFKDEAVSDCAFQIVLEGLQILSAELVE
jgi:hypothetical protein